MTDPSAEQIAQWKNEYGSIFVAGNYYFRAITLHEFQSIGANTSLSSAEREEHFVAAALLYPLDQDVDHLPAGVFTQLAEDVLETSGFQNPQLAKMRLDSIRNRAKGSVYTLMKAMILATIPSYREEELDDLTFEQLLEKVVLAEQVIEVHQAIMSGDPVTLMLVDPEEEVQEQQEQRQKHAAQKKQGTAGFDDPIARKLHNMG